MAAVISEILTGETTATEDQGTIRSAKRTFLVTGLTSGSYAVIGEALNTAGIPSYGDSYPGNANIICRSRTARVYGESDPDKVIIEVEYTTVGLEDGTFRFRCSTSVSEEGTSNDVNGNLVTLSYTYPTGYPNPEFAGTTSSQAAELTVYRPEPTLSTTGIASSSDPQATVSSWAGYLNSDVWNSNVAGTWLCTLCNFEPHDLGASPPKYKFTFEFQLNRRGWTQTAYFRTEDSGKIPSDLVNGVGYKRVVVNGYRPFNTGPFAD